MWAPLLRDCSVSYLMFSSILRRKPAAPSHQLQQPKLSPDMDKCPQGDKTTFTHIDNHYSRWSWQEGKEKSICIAILMLWLNLSFWILPEVSVEDLDFLCYRIQAHSALPTAGQWIWETRCWGKEFDYIWKACRPRLQTNVSKQPSYWHLDARFFYRTETGGSEGAK